MAAGLRESVARPWAARAFFAVAAIWLGVSGTLYSFPMWTTRLQAEFALNQAQTNAMGSVLYAATLLGVVLPFLLGRVRKMPLIVPLGAAGVVPQTLGWALLWMVSTRLVGPPLPLLLVASFLIGLGAGSIFTEIMSQSVLLMEDSSSLFVSSFYTLSFGVGGVASSFWLIFADLSFFFFLLFLLHGCVGLVASLLLWRLLVFSSYRGAESQVLLEASARARHVGLATLAKQFFSSGRSWLVLLIVFIKIGIGGAFAANMEDFVGQSGASFDAQYLTAFFNAGQTVGRLGTVLLGLWRDLTVTVVGAVALSYAIILAVAAGVPSAAFALSLVFSVAYGAMWSTTSSIVFCSSVTNRRQFLTLALFVFPLSGAGPIATNAVVGVIFDDTASFMWPWIFLALLSGLLFVLAVVLGLLHRRAERAKLSFPLTGAMN